MTVEQLYRPVPGVVSTTVVVPTFNEAGNVAALVDRLERACGSGTEVLFVDDSTDDTPDVIRAVADRARVPVRLVHRPPGERDGGLSGAVVRGLREASGGVVVVMDGDLQHPPEVVPELVAQVSQHGADLAVASRYAGDGDASGLAGRWRRSVSGACTSLARALFPRRVGRVCTDPMTGFFCVDRDAVDPDRLRPRGFKILLEILARHDLDVREVPFVFGERSAGESKASWRQGLAFVAQLGALRFERVMRFGLVGLSGVVVNLAVMAVLVGLGVHYVIASVLATQVAILSNFLLGERLVFFDRRHGGWRARAVRVFGYNTIEAVARLPVLALFVEVAGLHEVGAQGLLLVLAFGLRYTFMSRVVYRLVPRGGRPQRAAVSPVAATDAVPDAA